jgi:hypothetical protein
MSQWHRKSRLKQKHGNLNHLNQDGNRRSHEGWEYKWRRHYHKETQKGGGGFPAQRYKHLIHRGKQNDKYQFLSHHVILNCSSQLLGNKTTWTIRFITSCWKFFTESMKR